MKWTAALVFLCGAAVFVFSASIEEEADLNDKLLLGEEIPQEIKRFVREHPGEMSMSDSLERYYNVRDVAEPKTSLLRPLAPLAATAGHGLTAPQVSPYPVSPLGYHSPYGGLSPSAYQPPALHPENYPSAQSYGMYPAHLPMPYSQSSQPSYDSMISEVSQPHTHYTSVPYISGYRMTPVYAEKQIIVKDFAQSGISPHMSMQSSGPYRSVGHSRSANNLYFSDAEYQQPFDLNILFREPIEARSAQPDQLLTSEEYDNMIGELRNQIEHLQSLQKNVVSDDENIV